MCIICVLIPILTGLICALLGYLLGRLFFKKSREYRQLVDDLETCRKKSTALQLALDNLNKEHSDLKMSFLSSVEPVFDAGLAAQVFGFKIKQNDLKIVEGIGPKIEMLFQDAGILTWRALSELSVGECQKILDQGGDTFRMHNPATWPKQCELAYKGMWQELKDWQDKLQAGKE